MTGSLAESLAQIEETAQRIEGRVCEHCARVHGTGGDMNETAQEQEMLTRRLALVKAANAIQSDSLDAARMWLELADRIPARGWDSSGEV